MSVPDNHCALQDNCCAPVTLFQFRPSRACSTLSTCPGETLGMVGEVADIVMDMEVDMVAVILSDFHSVSVSEP